ncbi:tRNA (adenosine(37)-N6)-threonylcarbamoyltransferase complex transferase subunit TsaD [Cryomorphaceae bacterium 1068]|nr:tRNA (adenosine(37)-N6)-threonylcarbamoyltransferase complex transferase subunit TsaD [Cryomorphaceae bacterium 1068]
MNEREPFIVLGIESSCDDTSASVIKNDRILANVVATQTIHEAYGGVVPELASRAHQKSIIPVVDAALKEAGIHAKELSAIAYTRGPGLLGSLLVGSSFAKSMAQSLGIPALPIHHMKAHVLAHFINDGSATPPFPFLCLTVSGGHTQLIKVQNADSFIILGETMDDAAGEAFDKAAKMMGLPYPGGPEVDQLAEKGDPLSHIFSWPKVNGHNFSFSGLKTNILNYLEKNRRRDPDFVKMNLEDLCASVRYTIVEILMKELVEVAREQGLKHIALAGGVSANRGLRKALEEKAVELGWTTYVPKMEYCTDNGAMIAIAGYYKLIAGETGQMDVAATARWKMD